VKNKNATLVVLPCQSFYSGLSTLLDNMPRDVWIKARDLSSLFVEDILEPEKMAMHPEVLKGFFIASDPGLLEYGMEIILENYDCLHTRLYREMEKVHPFLLEKRYHLENLFLYTGSYSLGLRIEEHENKSSYFPCTTPFNL